MFDEPITTRKTPFMFLRMLVSIEFFFALLPIVATLIFPVQEEYNQTILAQSLSYNVLLTIIITFLQILIIIISFFSWYLPIFRIDRQRISYKRSGSVDFSEQIPLDDIRRVEIRQRWLGRRFDYGNLLIYGDSADKVLKLKDIPDPVGTANRIERWVSDLQDLKLPPENKPTDELIADGEGQFVEFKSSLMWDYRKEEINKNLNIPILKNIAAFLNSSGGTLLIGVNDDGTVLGLDADFAVMKKPNPDGFELIFNNAFNNAIGVEFRRFVQLSFPEIEGKIICLAAVQPATHPVYFQHHDREDFYIRAGNACQPLSVSKATAYIRDHFKL